jgi:hypothetical protein
MVPLLQLLSHWHGARYLLPLCFLTKNQLSHNQRAVLTATKKENFDDRVGLYYTLGVAQATTPDQQHQTFRL